LLGDKKNNKQQPQNSSFGAAGKKKELTLILKGEEGHFSCNLRLDGYSRGGWDQEQIEG